MKKNIKKGFTLVELLVVIAILAILGAVSIVGYTSFTGKAKQSVAEQEMTQIKTLLLADWLDGEVGETKKSIVREGEQGNYCYKTEAAVSDLLLVLTENDFKTTVNFYGGSGTINKVEFKASNGYHGVWDIAKDEISGLKDSDWTAPTAYSVPEAPTETE